MDPIRWISEGEVGTSSRTIWTAMMGGASGPRACGFEYDTPKDPDDFRRCLLLLQLFPEWRHRLSEVAQIFPKYKPMVDRWNEMEALWREESPSGKCPKLYDLMKQLNDEGMILDGWKRTGPRSWERAKGRERSKGCESVVILTKQ